MMAISRKAFHSKDVLEHCYQDRGDTFLVVKTALTIRDIQLYENCFIYYTIPFFLSLTYYLPRCLRPHPWVDGCFCKSNSSLDVIPFCVWLSAQTVIFHVVQCIISSFMSFYFVSVPRSGMYFDSNHTACRFSIASIACVTT